MTREDGWFDFMVNGGGAVTLQFGKSPFPPRIETLFAPWNEVNHKNWQQERMLLLSRMGYFQSEHFR